MSKKSRPMLSDSTADKLLANVFDACGQEPNAIPLSKLAAYSEYRREKYSFQKVILAVVLFIFVLLPLCFISPKFTIVRTSPDTAKTPIFEIRVEKGLIPVKIVGASIEGHSLDVYETGDRTFTVQPIENGLMAIKVSLVNFQYDIKHVTISGVDVEAPHLVKNEKIGDKLYLYLEDEGLGIDWKEIYAETDSGAIVEPIEISEDKSVVVFAFPEENMNIYITDLKDNLFQLVLTV